MRGPDDSTPPVLYATFDNNYVRDNTSVTTRFDAVKYDATVAVAGGGVAGDRLTLRITPQTGGPNAIFLPNGDGPTTMGRIPHFVLPK